MVFSDKAICLQTAHLVSAGSDTIKVATNYQFTLGNEKFVKVIEEFDSFGCIVRSIDINKIYLRITILNQKTDYTSVRIKFVIQNIAGKTRFNKNSNSGTFANAEREINVSFPLFLNSFPKFSRVYVSFLSKNYWSILFANKIEKEITFPRTG